MSKRILIILCAVALTAPLTLAQQIRTLKVIKAAVVNGPRIDPKTFAGKVPQSLLPSDLSKVRSVVVELTFVPEKMTSKGGIPVAHEIMASDFVASYSDKGGQHITPCVGLSFGEDWMLAKNGNTSVMLVFNKPGETRSEKTLFLLPIDSTEFMLELNRGKGERVPFERLKLPRPK